MDARTLVGMTQGARRRRLWDAFFDEAWDGATINNFRTEAAKYRLGQRLRPCPGCQECGVRRFTKPEGFFTDNTHYIEIRNNAKVRLWRLKHTPILWRSKCGPRSVPTTFYDLEYCVGMVERFEWIELTQPNLCDGSGVIPAKARKVRR